MKFFPLFLILIIFLSCESNDSYNHQIPQVAAPSDSLNVAFLIMDGVYNTELTAPFDIFHHTIFHTTKGMKVFTVADKSSPIKTFEGLQILPDYNYKTDQLPTIDVLVVPSAEHHLDSDLENNEMIKFVHLTGKQAQYVLSLCDGAFVLAKAGLLNDVVSTTFPGDIEQYKKMFPHLKVEKDVLFVHDGKYITSAGGARSFEASMYIVELLYGNKVAKGVGKGMVIDWDLNNHAAKIIQVD